MERKMDLFSRAVKVSDAKKIDLSAIPGVKEKYGDAAVTITISKEAKQFLESEKARKKMEEDTAALYESIAPADFNPDDPFSTRGNDQWAVFSKYLYDNGYYDDLSDEDLNKTETLLMNITDGLDGIYRGTGTCVELTSQISSSEANLELESSTAALKVFSETYVSSDLREGFDKLIGAYYSHNKDVVKNHMSIEERFNAARAKIPERSKQRLKEQLHDTVSPEAAAQAEGVLALRDFFGSISHTEEHIKQNNAFYAQSFEQIADGASLDDTMGKIISRFVSFAVNGSSDRKMQDYVSNNASGTFSRIHGYWAALLK
jgi:hypothetical protein